MLLKKWNAGNIEPYFLIRFSWQLHFTNLPLNLSRFYKDDSVLWCKDKYVLCNFVSITMLIFLTPPKVIFQWKLFFLKCKWQHSIFHLHHFKDSQISMTVLCNRQWGSKYSVSDCSKRWPLATCRYGAHREWLVRMRNWIYFFNF